MTTNEQKLVNWASKTAVKIAVDSGFCRVNFDKYSNVFAENVLINYESYKDWCDGDTVTFMYNICQAKGNASSKLIDIDVDEVIVTSFFDLSLKTEKNAKG